jgi:hypothetical protein
MEEELRVFWTGLTGLTGLKRGDFLTELTE